MTGSWALAAPLAVAVGAAVTDWWAVATGRAPLERWAKPAVMVALLVAVLGQGWAVHGAAGSGSGGEEPAVDGVVVALLAVGVAAGLTGDVLLLPDVDLFVPGLAAFLVGHLAYGLAFAQLGMHAAGLAAGAAVAVAMLAGPGRRILSAAWGRDAALGRAVAGYLVVICVMVALAVASGRPAVAVGAALFAASDAVLGWTRFVRPERGGRRHVRLSVMVTYHTAQILIVTGVLAGGRLV